jgi:DNA-binding MarR family transcriptional regulator
MTISEIAEAVNVRPSTVSKMMDRLEDRGLAKRLPSETDARLTHAELTDEGRAVCKKLRVLCAAIDDELQSDLSEDEAKRMVESLTLLDTVLAKRLKRLR